MAKLTATLLGTAALLASAAPVASAQTEDADPGTPIYVDQLQLEDVWSNVQVHVNGSDSHISATGLSAGNSTTSYVGDGAMSVDSTQVNAGETGSAVHVEAEDISNGDVSLSNTASGNASYAGNWFGNADANINQAQTGDVWATTHTELGPAQNIYSQTSAAANTAETVSDFGDRVDVEQEQFSDADVASTGRVYAGSVNDTLVNASIGAGNASDVAVDSVGEADINSNQVTTADTEISTTSLTGASEASNAFTSTNSAGNTFNVSSRYSDTRVGTPGDELNQDNNAAVLTTTYTEIATVTETITATATGVGNSAQASVLGGAVSFSAVQNNTGRLDTFVSLNTANFNGGAGHASSTAFGNSYGAAVQDGALSGAAIQTNAAAIRSSTYVPEGRFGHLSAASTAIGNAASFDTRNTGGQD